MCGRQGAFEPRTTTLREQRLEKVVLSDTRSAALLVRIWFEDGPEEFRARLTAVGRTADDVPAGDDLTIALASSPSEVITAVREWLDESLRSATEPIDGGP
jgi:hypothetical protein